MNRLKSNLILATFFTFSVFGNGLAQTDTTEIIEPILLDKEALSGIGLQKVDLKDEPDRDFFQRRLYRGEDISIYVVSSESWKTTFSNFSFDEFVYILNGMAKVKIEGGKEQTFNSQEFFSIPKGYTGSWEVIAGSNYHYELSVITTKRASLKDTTKIKNPNLFNKVKVSGVDIHFSENEQYEDILFEGDELKISIKAEKPRKLNSIKLQKDQLICILSGQVLIKGFSGNEQMFYTGDFLVLPKGFKGSWESNGHGLFKSIVVEQSIQ